MIASRFPYRLILVLLAMLNAAVAPAAALTCAPQAIEACAGASTSDDCSKSGTAHDCAMACAPLCGAVMPQARDLASPRFEALPAVKSAASALPLRHIGPEPPPPRMN